RTSAGGGVTLWLRVLTHQLGTCHGAALAEDVAADHQALDLGRPLPDLVDLGVAHEALDGVFLDVPVATEHLHGVDGDAHGDIATEQLGHRALTACVRHPVHRHPAGPPGEQARAVARRGSVAQSA